VETEKKSKQQAELDDNETNEDKDSPKFLGFDLPQFVVDFQHTIQKAEITMTDLIEEEVEARVWNATKANPPPASQDPAQRPTSAEISQAYQGIDYVMGFSESLVLSPLLFSTFFKYADPLYSQDQDDEWRQRNVRLSAATETELEELEQRMDQVRHRAVQRIQNLEQKIPES
jgi:hypothetical protein